MHRPVRLGALSIDLASGTTDRGPPITGKELELLRYLAGQSGRIVARDELLREVWAYSPKVVTRVVDLCISRLRRRIEPDPFNPAYLKTVHGEGYVLVSAPPIPGVSERAAVEPGPFVGREPCLEFLATWAEESQGDWLTIVGAPGIGKSRLAREAHRRLAADPAIGPTALVRLEGARTPLDVVSRVGIVLGLHVDALGDPIPWLTRRLAGRPLLLFLDDVDGAREAILHMQRSLGPGGTVRMVATGRRALGFPGERLLRLGPLAEADAATLFGLLCGRAPDSQAAKSAGSPTRWNLGGNPLAITLVAASLRAGRDPGSTPGGLDEALENSWARLPAEIAGELARLSEFAGGFDEDAALGAACASGAGLDQLLEESLVEELGPLLGLHPAIRDFARRKLEASGTAEPCRARHAAWHLDQLGAALASLRGAHRRDAFRVQLARLDDIGLAWTRAIAGRDTRRLAATVEALEEVVARAGLWLQGRHWFSAALEVARDDADLRTNLLAALAPCLFNLGEGRQAWDALGRALAETELSPSRRIRLLCARVRAGTGNVSDAELASDALELCRCPAADTGQRLQALLASFHVRAMANLQVPAVAEASEAVELATAVGEPGRLGLALQIRGVCALRAGDPAGAMRDLEAAGRLFDEQTDAADHAFTMGWEAVALGELGRTDEALERMARVEGIFERQGAVPRLWAWRRNRSLFLFNIGRMDECEALLGEILRASRHHELRRLEMSTLETIVGHRATTGRWAEARSFGAEARATGERYNMARAPGGEAVLAVACLQMGDPAAALAHAHTGLELGTAWGLEGPTVQGLNTLRALAEYALASTAELWPAVRSLLRTQPKPDALTLWGAACVLSGHLPLAAGLCAGLARAGDVPPPFPALLDALCGSLAEQLGGQLAPALARGAGMDVEALVAAIDTMLGERQAEGRCP